jgi:Flp pilus assembly protein TadG
VKPTVTEGRRQEGVVAVVVAIMLVVLLAFVALAVDVGGMYLRRRELVNGSDAAALSAARTCARGGVDRFSSPEAAADYQVQQNAPITAAEVAPTNLLYRPPICGDRYGHVTVRYTSQQSLYFAPVLGFDRTSPVTAQATASWGLGSNNSLPTVISNVFAPGTCAVPPKGTIAIGQQCVFWYDNDTLGGGNFTFLSLNARGWDVPSASNCSQSSSGGTSTLTKWINGRIPTSVSLNWTDPTYVCTDTGIRGVGGKGGPNSQVWSAFAALIGSTRNFPINWEGCGTPTSPVACSPVPGAMPQSTIYRNGQIDKYDIIGFAAMTILHVYGASDPGIGGSPALDYTCSGKNANAAVSPGVYTWSQFSSRFTGCQTPPAVVDSVTNISIPNLNSPADYTFDTTGITLTKQIPKQTTVAFKLHTNATPGACGPVPSNSSAVCIVTSWQGSTLSDDYQPSQDNVTVVRLCDLTYNTCLDR